MFATYYYEPFKSLGVLLHKNGMYSLAHLLPLGQRKHIIELYFRPLTLKRSIVIGGKHDTLIPMGTRVTPKPPVCMGKVVELIFLTIICVPFCGKSSKVVPFLSEAGTKDVEGIFLVLWKKKPFASN